MQSLSVYVDNKLLRRPGREKLLHSVKNAKRTRNGEEEAWAPSLRDHFTYYKARTTLREASGPLRRVLINGSRVVATLGGLGFKGYIPDRVKNAEKRLEQNVYDIEAWSILLRDAQLFQRCLMKVLNIDLWRCYLTYVKETKGALPTFRLLHLEGF
ncbi:hypothetical protein HPB47_027995 [Ixodes persulcatus]|uniref:Uncharacterized protein n=1 Tax=Ixodes persulcatus TaxID=34615 RepID=A0AC60PUF3_IXOPE|nr:hypothetical protein HPB47_027995 [Ixodes persulcatus]